jgi:hypothetical protein
MKNTSIVLSVDYIGGQSSLTQAEEIALSEYFKLKKIKSEAKKSTKRTNTPRRKLEKS